MKLLDSEKPKKKQPETEPQISSLKEESGLIFEHDYLKFTWDGDPDPFVVCYNNKKLELVKKQFPGLVIYTAEEVRELQKAKHSLEGIKGIHLVKKKFLGSEVVKCISAEK